MAFSKIHWKKNSSRTDERSLYPIQHVADSLKEFQQELVGKEVESLGGAGHGGQFFHRRHEKGGQFP